MRFAVVLLASLLIAAPAAAQYNAASSLPRECKRIMKQLVRYEGDVQMARDRGNKLWENATLDHMGRLETRLYDRCPELEPENEVAKFFAKIIDVAAVAAWKYLTYEY